MSDEPTSPAPLAPAVSPLEQADPNSINELIDSERLDRIFNTPALNLTDDDIRFQIEYYRKERHRFLLESQQKEANKAAPRAKKAAPKSVADALVSSADLI